MFRKRGDDNDVVDYYAKQNDLDVLVVVGDMFCMTEQDCLDQSSHILWKLVAEGIW
jgi:hypothetical protein